MSDDLRKKYKIKDTVKGVVILGPASRGTSGNWEGTPPAAASCDPFPRR
jgi:hypothetical protein